MTIETSLRYRALWCRCLAVLWLAVITLILTCVYISLPTIVGAVLEYLSLANKSLAASGSVAYNYQLMIIVITVAELALALSVSYIFARSAYVESETAARLTGIADALCIAGSDIDKFEKAAAILVPRSKILLSGGPMSKTDLKPLADIIKLLRV